MVLQLDICNFTGLSQVRPRPPSSLAPSSLSPLVLLSFSPYSSVHLVCVYGCVREGERKRDFAQTLQPMEVAQLVHGIFSGFDDIVRRGEGLFKMDTVRIIGIL